MNTNSLLSKSLKPIFILANDIGCTINDIFHKIISISVVKSAYELTFFKKLKYNKRLCGEFFVWSWVMAEYICKQYMISHNKENDVEFVDRIFSDFIEVTFPDPDSPERVMYLFWNKCIDDKILENNNGSSAESVGSWRARSVSDRNIASV